MAVIWIGAGRFAPAYDPDAQAYITAVEAADTQALEVGVKDAINAFVVGCKADGIWSAIKACCILAGARTLSGALVPLVGAAPTNFNFVAGDYNRKTGLKGNQSNKTLQIPGSTTTLFGAANNCSFGLWLSEKDSISSAGQTLLGNTGNSLRIDHNSSSDLRARINDNNNTIYAGTNVVGFIGAGRNTASHNTKFMRGGGSTYSAFIAPSLGLETSSIYIFSRIVAYSNARIAFYWLGNWVDLALLDTRVTDLINAFAAAIP